MTALLSEGIVKETGEADVTSSSARQNGVHEIDHLDLDRYPGVLVLGFQELDLSTEALIYSMNTLREDAWCRAVFAASEKDQSCTIRYLVSCLLNPKI
jgi:hypothetical protein